MCGLLQIAENEEAIEVDQLVAAGVDVHQVQYKCELKLLQDSAPVDVCSLVAELCELLAPFQLSIYPSPFHLHL